LRAKLPQCKARVLCDVAEVKNPDWQAALEGYIGYDRFTILYDRAYETQIVVLAKLFRRENVGQRGNISVPQLSLAIEDHPRVDQDSIVSLLKISNDVEAEGYLKARYGRTIMVRDTAKLKNTRSGVMQDGWSTQGYCPSRTTRVFQRTPLLSGCRMSGGKSASRCVRKRTPAYRNGGSSAKWPSEVLPRRLRPIFARLF
jgi:hypothetical protein